MDGLLDTTDPLYRAYMAGLAMGEDGLQDGEKLDRTCREDRFLEWLYANKETL
jgi:hypothetical protein